jgi:hypothetical protein
MADDFARRAVVVWMKDVMKSRGWTPQEWARLAKTTRTNITRVITANSGITPGLATVYKLARVAGSQPNLVPTRPHPRPEPDVVINFCPSCGTDIKSALASATLSIVPADQGQTVIDKDKLWTWSPDVGGDAA